MNKGLINKEEVIKVSKLANLELTEEEIGKFEPQLEEIIEYNINLLNEVDTKVVEPTVGVGKRSSVTREDQVEPGLSTEEALQNAEEKHNDFFKVKAILEQ